MSHAITLRPVVESDLEVFFEHQLDPAANAMAAFGAAVPRDRAAFDAKWRALLDDPGVFVRTIVAEDDIVGHIAVWRRDGRPEVTYWIGRAHWGRGCATAALRALLEQFPERPLHASTVSDNIASRRVLEKCGFTVTGSERAYARGRGEEVEEVMMVLGE